MRRPMPAPTPLAAIRWDQLGYDHRWLTHVGPELWLSKFADTKSSDDLVVPNLAFNRCPKRRR